MSGCLAANWFHVFFSFRKTIADLNDSSRQSRKFKSESQRDEQRRPRIIIQHNLKLEILEKI